MEKYTGKTLITEKSSNLNVYGICDEELEISDNEEYYYGKSDMFSGRYDSAAYFIRKLQNEHLRSIERNILLSQQKNLLDLNRNDQKLASLKSFTPQLRQQSDQSAIFDKLDAALRQANISREVLDKDESSKRSNSSTRAGCDFVDHLPLTTLKDEQFENLPYKLSFDTISTQSDLSAASVSSEMSPAKSSFDIPAKQSDESSSFSVTPLHTSIVSIVKSTMSDMHGAAVQVSSISTEVYEEDNSSIRQSNKTRNDDVEYLPKTTFMNEKFGNLPSHELSFGIESTQLPVASACLGKSSTIQYTYTPVPIYRVPPESKCIDAHENEQLPQYDVQCQVKAADAILKKPTPELGGEIGIDLKRTIKEAIAKSATRLTNKHGNAQAIQFLSLLFSGEEIRSFSGNFISLSSSEETIWAMNYIADSYIKLLTQDSSLVHIVCEILSSLMLNFEEFRAVVWGNIVSSSEFLQMRYDICAQSLQRIFRDRDHASERVAEWQYMEGAKIRVYLNLLSYQLPDSNGSSYLSKLWRFAARVINSKSAFASFVLAEILQSCGAKLKLLYGLQFNKLLKLLRTAVVPAWENSIVEESFDVGVQNVFKQFLILLTEAMTSLE